MAAVVSGAVYNWCGVYTLYKGMAAIVSEGGYNRCGFCAGPGPSPFISREVSASQTSTTDAGCVACSSVYN